MKFTVGYQLPEEDEEPLTAIVADFRDRIAEVYFPWLDQPSGRSPMSARTVKEHFPGVEVRASINLRLGTVKALEYVADVFDSFNVQREHNRDLDRIREIKAWAEAHGKRLQFLANSGCLSFCSGQVFHDNLVAHEAEIARTVNTTGWNPSQCWNYLADRSHWVALLQNTWIRPEDIPLHDGLFSVAKLATRMHANPRRVIRAYCEGRYRGNLLDLLEPSRSPLIAPHIIDNERFPADWFERTTACDKRCHACGYCEGVLDQVLVAC
jgi:collagenase-like PrtC family protease